MPLQPSRVFTYCSHRGQACCIHTVLQLSSRITHPSATNVHHGSRKNCEQYMFPSMKSQAWEQKDLARSWRKYNRRCQVRPQGVPCRARFLHLSIPASSSTALRAFPNPPNGICGVDMGTRCVFSGRLFFDCRGLWFRERHVRLGRQKELGSWLSGCMWY